MTKVRRSGAWYVRPAGRLLLLTPLRARSCSGGSSAVTLLFATLVSAYLVFFFVFDRFAVAFFEVRLLMCIGMGLGRLEIGGNVSRAFASDVKLGHRKGGFCGIR